jgi:hypothetical protein
MLPLTVVLDWRVALKSLFSPEDMLQDHEHCIDQGKASKKLSKNINNGGRPVSTYRSCYVCKKKIPPFKLDYPLVFISNKVGSPATCPAQN